MILALSEYCIKTVKDRKCAVNRRLHLRIYLFPSFYTSTRQNQDHVRYWSNVNLLVLSQILLVICWSFSDLTQKARCRKVCPITSTVKRNSLRRWKVDLLIKRGSRFIFATILEGFAQGAVIMQKNKKNVNKDKNIKNKNKNECSKSEEVKN
jgi:hypothetical protein